MPRKPKELTPLEVKRLKCKVNADGKPYNSLHPAGGVRGLFLQVTPSDARSWILRYSVGYKLDPSGEIQRDKNGQPVPLRHHLGLGSYPTVTLGQAREKAREALERIEAGIDPVEEKRAAKRARMTEQLKRITFAQAMRDYIEMKSKEFRSPRQRAQWENSLTAYALPVMGNMPVSEIELPHIKAVLDPIWQEKTETANRVRGRIEKILGWSAIHGYRSSENPARWKGYLDEVYPSPNKIKEENHHAALPVVDMPDFYRALQSKAGTAARALEFAILTAARTNEVIGDKRIGKAGITWQEIDLKRRVWTVPADRMKSGKIHKEPLTQRAVDVLEAMGPGDPDALVFTGGKGGIPSNNFLSAVLKRMGVSATVHGFRSTFKDWASEYTAYPDEVSELALSHVNSDSTRAAYARSQLIDKRRKLMDDWAAFCQHGHAEQADNVLTIGGARA